MHFRGMGVAEREREAATLSMEVARSSRIGGRWGRPHVVMAMSGEMDLDDAIRYPIH